MILISKIMNHISTYIIMSGRRPTHTQRPTGTGSPKRLAGSGQAAGAGMAFIASSGMTQVNAWVFPAAEGRAVPAVQAHGPPPDKGGRQLPFPGPRQSTRRGPGSPRPTSERGGHGNAAVSRGGSFPGHRRIF